MERVPPLKGVTVRVANITALALLLLPGLGCVTRSQMTHVTDSLKDVVVTAPPKPASQIACFWQRRLNSLPDPTRDGVQTAGIVGQVFLVSPDNQPADVSGDLAIVVYDETPRKPGEQAMKPELWHYTKETLKRLSAYDERFGRNYVVFLPWPSHWKDVTTVKILARYQTPGNPDLYSGEVRIALDFSSGGPVWNEFGTGQSGSTNPSNINSVDTRSVPDATKILQEMRGGVPMNQTPTTIVNGVPQRPNSGASGIPMTPGVVTTGAWAQPLPPPTGSYPAGPQAPIMPPAVLPAQPVGTSPAQPILIPQRLGN